MQKKGYFHQEPQVVFTQPEPNYPLKRSGGDKRDQNNAQNRRLVTQENQANYPSKRHRNKQDAFA